MSLLDDEGQERRGAAPMTSRIGTIAAAAAVCVAALVAAVWFWGGASAPVAEPEREQAARIAAGEPAGERPPEAPPPGEPEAPRAPLPRRPAPRRAPPPEPPAPVPPAPGKGVLHVESDVAGASVFLDRTFLGETPLTARDLDFGTHRLNVSASGYDGFATTVEITAEPQKVEIRFRQVSLDASIRAVHKHGIGSCQGTLRATTDGLEYQPDSGTHGFRLSFDRIRAFEMDYLEHNLRLVSTGGQTYNFTDREATPDSLFVFHRDVQQARERLAEGWPPA